MKNLGETKTSSVHNNCLTGLKRYFKHCPPGVVKVIENVCLDVYVLFLLQSLDEVFDVPNIKTGMPRGARHKGWYLQHGTVGT